MERIVVTGCRGLIGSNMISKLKFLTGTTNPYVSKFEIIGIDIKTGPSYLKKSSFDPDVFINKDLVDVSPEEIGGKIDKFYHFAADMGGVGYIGSHNDFAIMKRNLEIDLAAIDLARSLNAAKFIYSSSACRYKDGDHPHEEEEVEYPTDGYGIEKRVMENLLIKGYENNKPDFPIPYIFILNNVFGQNGALRGPRAKSPAALAYKAGMLKEGEALQVWGDGKQIRSYIDVDPVVMAIAGLIYYNNGPLIVNIGGDFSITVGELAQLALNNLGKKNPIEYIDGPVGANARLSSMAKFKELVEADNALGFLISSDDFTRTGFEAKYKRFCLKTLIKIKSREQKNDH